MSASEMLAFSLYFGILIGDLVTEDEPSWKFYILIRQIMDLLLSRSYTVETIQYLKALIEEHHQLFFELFDEPLKPKYHIVLHYPDIILKVGPLRNLWCMKFEAYHKLLKSTVNSTSCHKNLLVTLTTKDSLRFSQRILSKKGFHENIDFHALHENLDFLARNDFFKEFSKDAFCASWVTIANICFKRDFIIQISDENLLLPDFAQIKHIIIDDNNIYFIVMKIFTVAFLGHIFAYEVNLVQYNQNLFLINYNDITNPYPYNTHFTGDGKSVIIRI